MEQGFVCDLEERKETNAMKASKGGQEMTHAG